MNSSVIVRWQETPQPGSFKNRMAVIRHNKTYYFYLNLPRSEAEARFLRGVVDSADHAFSDADALSKLDGQSAEGYEVDFDDEFFIWTNAAEQTGSLEALLRGLA